MIELSIEQCGDSACVYRDGVMLGRKEALDVLSDALEYSLDDEGTNFLIHMIRLIEAEERRLS